MKTLIIATVAFFVFGGCASLRSRDTGGFKGPEPYVTVARNSVDPILAAFQMHYSLDLEWKWDKWLVTITEVDDVPGRFTGRTFYPSRIEVERGNTAVIPHEMIHAIANRNGMPSGPKGSPTDHHVRFKKMFDQFGW